MARDMFVSIMARDTFVFAMACVTTTGLYLSAQSKIRPCLYLGHKFVSGRRSPSIAVVPSIWPSLSVYSRSSKYTAVALRL
jgi:hypothetical protein